MDEEKQPLSEAAPPTPSAEGAPPPDVETPSAVETPAESEPPPPAFEAVSEPPSQEAGMEAAQAPAAPGTGERLAAFFRRLLTWALGALLLFGIGFLVAFFTLYQPMKAHRDDLSAETQTLQSQIADLEGKNRSLQAQVDGLEQKKAQLERTIQTLQDEIARLDAQNALLLAEANVADARRALAGNNPEGARLYIQAAVSALQLLASALPDQQEVVMATVQRLEAARKALTDDPATAEAALTVAAENLAQLAAILAP